MNDYDFSALNDKEFENLTIDLISRDRGKRFERFKAGRDGGIDGRFYGEDGKEEIIQCKHYLKTGYSGLISSLKKKNSSGVNEADKVKNLNPKKYIFVTSLQLSSANKKDIKEIFEPYIKSDSDIYGQEDLNDLLKNNSDIEENHYKLWISSTTVLQRIFNNAIKGRSEFELEEIQAKMKYYVVTENHNNAIRKLEDSHTIIIAGEPGIGKTTLAEQIVLNYIEKGFEFCVIADSIREAEDIFEKDKKQIFYFDDFLGSNYLNALEAHTDSHIMQFILRVKKDKNKRFILTSRTNIFNQSILLSDKFRTKKLDSDEFIIKVDDLKDIDKAYILYNHLWHSNLDEENIDELYKEERYKKIISHKNFNPRIIEFITDIDRIKSVSATDYWNDIQTNLDNPSEIWANTFDSQSDEFIRNVVALVVFNGNSIIEEELQKAYNTLNELSLLQNSSHNNREFDSVIKQTVKYFLNRKILSNGNIEYSLFNPSIADFIINRYVQNKNKLKLCFVSLKTSKALNILESLNISKTIYKEIIIEMLNIKLDKLETIDYILNASYLLFKEEFLIKNDSLILFLLNDFINTNKIPLFNEDIVYKFIKILTFYIKESKLEINNLSFLETLINEVNMDNSTILASMLMLLELFPEKDRIKNKLNLELNDYIYESLNEEKDNIDFSVVDTYIEKNNYDETGLIYDEDEIINQLKRILDDIIEEFEFDITHLIEKEAIVNQIDVSNIIYHYEMRGIEGYYEYADIKNEPTDIDDLFQRS